MGGGGTVLALFCHLLPMMLAHAPARREPPPMRPRLSVVAAESAAQPAAAARRTIVETWFARHAKELGRFLRRYIRDERDIEDCVQETFLQVWRQEQRGGLNGDTQGYLFNAAINVARDRHRRDSARGGSQQHDSMQEELADERAADAETSAHWNEGLRRLEQALSGLRPSTRNVFLLYHLENLTYPDIARRLGVTTRTVEREMARALAHCAGPLRPYLTED